MKKTSQFLYLVLFSHCISLAIAVEDGPQQSKTGPEPPKIVTERDAQKALEPPILTQSEVTISIPGYSWRHGCGPTAVGMVIGYYDSHGFADLIPGESSTQTGDVNQAIASGGTIGNPNPPGSEQHCEYYSIPQDDSTPTILPDDYITQGRTAHTDNCIADYMNTSKSTNNNRYGWSWSSGISPSFVSYVNQQNQSYNPVSQEFRMSDNTLTWNVLTTEIDSNRGAVEKVLISAML